MGKKGVSKTHLLMSVIGFILKVVNENENGTSGVEEEKIKIESMIQNINGVLELEKYDITEKEVIKKSSMKQRYYNVKNGMDSEYVYFVKEEGNGYVKIGKATDPLKRIVDGFGAKSPYKLNLLYLIATNNPFEVENWFHKKYENKRINGEWFDLSKEDIKTILQSRIKK